MTRCRQDAVSTHIQALEETPACRRSGNDQSCDLSHTCGSCEVAVSSQGDVPRRPCLHWYTASHGKLKGPCHGEHPWLGQRRWSPLPRTVALIFRARTNDQDASSELDLQHNGFSWRTDDVMLQGKLEMSNLHPHEYPPCSRFLISLAMEPTTALSEHESVP
jgi:hypothetical protein